MKIAGCAMVALLTFAPGECQAAGAAGETADALKGAVLRYRQLTRTEQLELLRFLASL
jgi:hypothetical protein